MVGSYKRLTLLIRLATLNPECNLKKGKGNKLCLFAVLQQFGMEI
jgi:hypothetical protein